MNTTPVSAFQLGKNAYTAGKRRNANPYHYHHPDHERWDEGWVEAESEANSL